ncbi:hypothetical protein F5Y16DRAFT_393331 [Xylariaceae sp. FL0255]|nr:hypothetical protein F5Y16DRAFT_393331 [Xylariaceae sp. FL0255]
MPQLCFLLLGHAAYYLESYSTLVQGSSNTSDRHILVKFVANKIDHLTAVHIRFSCELMAKSHLHCGCDLRVGAGPVRWGGRCSVSFVRRSSSADGAGTTRDGLGYLVICRASEDHGEDHVMLRFRKSASHSDNLEPLKTYGMESKVQGCGWERILQHLNLH